MEATWEVVKKCALMNDEYRINELLKGGLDPDFEGGWPLRLAARHGSYAVVKTFIDHGANPHLLGDLGASPLQLAVFSNLHWKSDKWVFLLSCYNCSQLADGAAVAIVFKNILALKKIFKTGRVNPHVPTSLTGKTLKELAKAFKMEKTLENISKQHPSPRIKYNKHKTLNNDDRSPLHNQEINNNHILTVSLSPVPSTSSQGQLSPSVARFFHQASHSALTPPRPTTVSSQWSPFS